jgi:hypothetical protein
MTILIPMNISRYQDIRTLLFKHKTPFLYLLPSADTKYHSEISNVAIREALLSNRALF